MRKTHFTAALVMAALSGSLFAQTLVTVNGQAIDSSVIDGQVAALRAENKQIQDSPQLRQELTSYQHGYRARSQTPQTGPKCGIQKSP